MKDTPNSSSLQNREPDVSFKWLLRSWAILATFILKQAEQEAYEQRMREPRYVEYAFKPVSAKEKQRIILAHQWVESVRDACSDILGVGNRHR